MKPTHSQDQIYKVLNFLLPNKQQLLCLSKEHNDNKNNKQQNIKN